MKPKLPDDLEIAPGYTVGCWKRLKLDPDVPNSDDWEKAVKIFDARIRKRFFHPVDVLIEHQSHSKKTFGFAILAIDFLVIETLQGFREDEIDHKRISEKLFTNFLKQWGAFTACLPGGGDPKKFAGQVYHDYRCALHHSGSTEGALRVGVSGAMFAFKNDHEVKINRTCLHENLKHEFEVYLIDLRNPDRNDLRYNFKKKMDAICGLGSLPKASPN